MKMLDHRVTAIDTDTPAPFYPLREAHPAPHVMASISLALGGIALLSQGWSQISLVVTIYDRDGTQPDSRVIAGGTNAKITALSDGGFAIGWVEQSSSMVAVRAQVFDATGSAIGSAFTVAQGDPYSAAITSYSLAGTSTGNLAFSWSVGSPFSYGASDVFAEIVSPSGSVVHAPAFFHSANYIMVQDIDVLADGRFVLSFTEQAPGATSTGPNPGATVLSIFNPANDTFARSIINIAPTPGYRVIDIDTALLSSGNFLVSWQEYGQSTNSSTFHGKIVTPTGTLIKDSFDKLLPSGAIGSPSSVLALPGGGFIIAYKAGTGSNYGIATQVFDGAGNAVNAPTITSNPDQVTSSNPVLATFGNGDVALAYNYAASVSTSDSTLKLLYPATSGTSSDDHLVSTADADVLLGLAGNDLIEGNAGNDILFGVSGDDRLYGGDGNDQLFGESENDLLDSGTGVNQLDGGAGDDMLIVANASGSTLIGGSGNDHLTADGGLYTLYGDGPDVSGSGNDDVITLTNGLSGSAAYGGVGNDILNLSGTGSITAEGGSGDDQITVVGFRRARSRSIWAAVAIRSS